MDPSGCAQRGPSTATGFLQAVAAVADTWLMVVAVGEGNNICEPGGETNPLRTGAMSGLNLAL